jgi:hypothetical protein
MLAYPRVVAGLSILALLPACQVAPSTGEQFADESSGESGSGDDTSGGGGQVSASAGESSSGDTGSDGAGEETSAGDTGVAESNGGTPQVCGNDTVEGTEECDQTDFGFRTCQTYGFMAGNLTCTDACTVDTASCSAESICGDRMITGVEDCEEGDVAGTTCETLDAGTGDVVCAPDCTFDASACSCKGEGEGCTWNPGMPSDPGGCCPAGIKGNQDGICHYTINGAVCI